MNTEQPKRGPGRPKTGRSVPVATYQQRARDRMVDKGIIEFKVRLPVQTVGLIKAISEATGKTRTEIIVASVEAIKKILENQAK